MRIAIDRRSTRNGHFRWLLIWVLGSSPSRGTKAGSNFSDHPIDMTSRQCPLLSAPRHDLRLPIDSPIILENAFRPCAASVSTHSLLVLGGLRRLSRIRIKAAATSSGDFASKRHRKTSGLSETKPTAASSLRSKSFRFQVTMVTCSPPDTGRRHRARRPAAFPSAQSIAEAMPLREMRKLTER